MSLKSLLDDSKYWEKTKILADEKIAISRKPFINVVNIAHEYVKKHNSKNEVLIVYDPEQTDTTKIYSSNPYRTAINITNSIYDKLDESDKNYVAMDTVFIHRKLTISFRMRRVIYIETMDTFNNESILKLIVPVIDKSLPCMPAEVRVLDYAHDLYTLKSIDNVKEFSDLVSVAIRSTKSNITTANNTIGGSAISYKQLILIQFMNGRSDCCVIGNHAISLIEAGMSGNSIPQSNDKLEIIISISINDFMNELLRFLRSMDSSIKLEYREENPHIHDNDRLRRYSIYQIICDTRCGNKTKHILDVFNAGEFEIIPTITSGRFLEKKNRTYPRNVLIGNYHVLVYFYFVDLWVLKIIYMSGKGLSENIVKRISNKIFTNLSKFDNRLAIIKNKVLSIEPESYFGIFKDPILHFKEQLKSVQRLHTYYPFKGLKSV